MAILSTNGTFGATDTVTSTKLNNIADAATFADPVDDSTLELNTADGKLRIKDDGVTLQKLSTAVKDALYPIGSIYTNATDSTNPATLIGFGTWVAFGSGRVLIGEGSDSDDQPTPETVSFTAGAEGGEYNHTLSVDEMPAHTHGVQVTKRVTGDDAANQSPPKVLTSNRNVTTSTVDIADMTAKSTGGGQAHNNLQPYIVVYMWKRTA